MFPRLLAVLLLLSFLHTSQAAKFKHVYRQDQTTDGGDGSAATDTGDEGTDATNAASASPDAPTDTGSSAVSATETDASAPPTASASSSSGSGTSGLSNGPGVLGGAGTNGGAVPSSCYNCENTYNLVNTCASEGSSESCSPICSGWSATITCLNCLLSNGQANLTQSAVQQVVWNLEASCQDVGISVSSATISATATTTGPFTTPSSATQTPTGVGATPTASHSGLTVYNDNTRAPAVTASISQIGYVANGEGVRAAWNGATVIGMTAVAVLVLL